MRGKISRIYQVSEVHQSSNFVCFAMDRAGMRLKLGIHTSELGRYVPIGVSDSDHRYSSASHLIVGFRIILSTIIYHYDYHCNESSSPADFSL